MTTTGPDPYDGDPVVQALGGALDAIEGAPAASVDTAIGLFALRRFGDELMELLDDSSLSGLAARGDAQFRLLAFTAPGCRIELDIDATGSTLVGEIEPYDAGRLEAVTPDGAHPVAIDDAGRFRLTGLRTGHYRFVLHRPDGHTVSTPVITL